MKASNKLTLGLYTLLALVGCGKEFDHTAIRQDGFVFCGQGRPTTFNPQLVDSGITVESLAPQLFDTLLTLDPVTHQPRPNVAKRWTVDESGTEYVFALREGIEFQTTDWFTPTRPMNASDVVFSFQRIIDKNNPFHYVGESIYPWFAAIDFSSLVADVTAIDDLHVRFTLTKPDNSFISNIATAHAPILSAEYAEQLRQSGKRINIDQFPIGTGPFYLDEYQVSDLVRLKRHDNYWGGKVAMQQVVFDISHRGAGALAKLLRQECDVLNSPISSQIPIIDSDEAVVLQAKPAMNTAFVAINTQHKALSDARVRQALSLAINRDTIIDAVYFGNGEKAYSLVPPGIIRYATQTTELRYDRNYAMALLRQAGFDNNIELNMAVPLEPRVYNPSPRKTAELIQANLADIGITIKLITDDRSKRVELTHMDNIDLLLTGWIGNTGEPDNYLRPLLSCNSKQRGLNLSSWCNPDFDALLDLALEASNPRYRANVYNQAQQILNQEMPVLPLAHGTKYQAHSVDLVGFKTSPFNSQPFDQVTRQK